MYFLLNKILEIEQTLLITAILSIFVFGTEICSVLVATYWVNKKVKLIINKQQFRLRKLIYDTSNINKKQNSDLLSIEFSVNSSFEIELSKKKLSEKQSLLKSFGVLSGNQISKYSATIGTFQLNLIQILSNENAFMIYAKFLLYELSLENIMFFIEIIQYKQCVYNKLFVNTKCGGDDEKSQSKHHPSIGGDEELFLLINFCDSIPISSIVYDISSGGVNNDYEYNIMLAARELYYKYVNEHAIYQINISYVTRRELDNIFDTKNDGRILNRIHLEKNSKNKMDALLCLFDGCVSEVLSLMMDSYQRIETSSHYKKLQTALDI